MTSLPLLRLHLAEDLVGVLLFELAEQVGGRAGIHLLDDVGGAVGIERFDDRHLDVGIDLFERLGGDLLVDRLEHRFALGRREILDDVGDVGRVQLRQALVGDLQLDAPRRIGLEQIDELPRDHPRRNPLEQRAQRERRDDALRQAPDRAAGADVDGDDVDREMAVDRRRLELDVVDADHLAAVDVDDLLVEQVALEEQQAVGRGEAFPLRRIGGGADGGAGRANRVRGEHALARRGLDDQECDAGRVILRCDRDFAHPSAHGAGGVAHGSAEQFGQGDDRHVSPSGGIAIRSIVARRLQPSVSECEPSNCAPAAI